MRNDPDLTLPSHEVLAKLASDDPQAFEALRSELIENFISHAAPRNQPRLRGLQFRVDAIRRLSRSPLGALMKIQSLMWESFMRMNRELQNAVSLVRGRVRMDAPAGRSARVIQFQPRSRVEMG